MSPTRMDSITEQTYRSILVGGDSVDARRAAGLEFESITSLTRQRYASLHRDDNLLGSLVEAQDYIEGDSLYLQNAPNGNKDEVDVSEQHYVVSDDCRPPTGISSEWRRPTLSLSPSLSHTHTQKKNWTPSQVPLCSIYPALLFRDFVCGGVICFFLLVITRMCIIEGVVIRERNFTKLVSKFCTFLLSLVVFIIVFFHSTKAANGVNEEKAHGTISLKTYLGFFRAGANYVVLFIILVLFILAEVRKVK